MPTVRYIAVHFDESSWNFWGIPWTASLNFLAKFPGQVVVVDFGISSKTHEFFKKLDNYIVIPAVKKYGHQDLDFVHTISDYAAKNKGVWATWDYTCYFQDRVDEVFDLASDKLLCCRGSDPQLNKSSISAFGYNESVTRDQERLFKILKKVARNHNKTLSDGFIAAPSELWAVYAKFLDICADTGFLVPEDQFGKAAINLFASNFDSLASIADDTWCQPIADEFEWEDGFCRNGSKVKVVHIPANMQYSADSASYHFRNRYSKLHDEWSSFYRGCSFNPKRIMKPSLGKLKKVT